MFETTASQIGLALVTAVCLFTAWAGGRPQKIVAAICFIAWITSAATQGLTFKRADYATLALDAVLMVVFVVMAIRARQPWLSGLAAFQTLTMASHFAMVLDARIWPRAAITAYLIWSYLVLACLFWGGVAGLLDRRRVAGGANREAGR
jgi:hypothetical protein